MTSTDIPKTMKAYVCQGLGSASIKDTVPVPYIGPDEVLIRNYAAAQNPTDWQCAFRLPSHYEPNYHSHSHSAHT